MKNIIFPILLGAFSVLPAQAATSPIYECAGSHNGQVILVDVLNAGSGQRYIKVTSEGERSFYLVDSPETKKGFYSANRVDPRTGDMLVGQAQLQIPSVLMNKARFEINGLKIDLKCSPAGVGGVRAY